MPGTWLDDQAALRLRGLLHVLEQHRLGPGADELRRVAHHRLGHTRDAVLLGELREPGDLDAVCGDLVARESKLESQANRPGAVGSSRRREHLDVDVSFERVERRLRLRRHDAGPRRDVEDRVDQ